MLIYPNPSNDYVLIEFNRSINIESQALFAIDITGRHLKVEFEQLTTNKYKVDLSKLSKGVYYFFIKDINSIKIGRPIIKL